MAKLAKLERHLDGCRLGIGRADVPCCHFKVIH